VPKLSGLFFTYDKRSRLGYPDDLIGPRGSANEIADSRTTDTYSTKSYAYKNYVDQMTLDNQDAPLDEMVDLTESLAEAMAFREEKRIAAVVTNASNYASSNKVTLGASAQWDSSGGGNPVSDIMTARAALWGGSGPGKIIAWSSLEVFNILARHPLILDLFKYGGTAPGLATPGMLAKFFGIDEYLIGEAREDTANQGQTASYGRLWGKYFGLARVADRPSIRTAAFGYTFRNGPMATDQWFDVSVGKRGGYYARTSVSEDHKIVAADTAYLISAPIG